MIDKINTVITGDCLEVMKDWERGCIDLILTDPPYNVGIKYTEATNDSMGDLEFIRWAKARFDLMPYPQLVFVGIKNLMLWRDIIGKPAWIISWIKRNGQGNTPLGGTNKWDAILCYDVFRDGGIDIIEVNNDYSEKMVSRGEHPTPKPLNLFIKLLYRFSREDSLILDPFCGSGTTCVAAKMLGRRYIGIDISSEYCKIARMRLKAVDTGVPVAEQRQGQKGLWE